MKSSTRLTTILLSGLLALTGCSQEESRLPSIVAAERSIELTVPATGELIASESLPVSLPGGVRMGFNISWMAPEFSEVKAGGVVARFDDTQILQERQATALTVARSDFALDDITRTSALEQVRLGHEANRVAGERGITETYTTVDERLFSRNEIIDALGDVAYLDVEAAFLEWQSETFDQRTTAERNTIRTEQQGEQAKLERQNIALGMMELRSPADGTFVYARTPWGAKLGKGKRVFAGMPVGNLPVRGKVAAEFYVSETDAVGLAEGQRAEFRLDALPERVYEATITTISAVASPLDRDDPRKFFTLQATIDDIDPDIMRVGSQLRATIRTGAVSDAIALPAQAVYGNDEDAWIFVATRGQAEKRAVTLGSRGPDLVEIASGVESGERVLLVAPEEAG
ncbi:MAG: HlyD family efflux transporter periplasmic adaptor subunit [Pseudomonadota bacterium]